MHAPCESAFVNQHQIRAHIKRKHSINVVHDQGQVHADSGALAIRRADLAEEFGVAQTDSYEDSDDGEVRAPYVPMTLKSSTDLPRHHSRTDADQKMTPCYLSRGTAQGIQQSKC